MSFSVTYTTLSSKLLDWEEENSTEFTAAIDDIIPLGESRLLRDLDLERFNVKATGAFTISDQEVTRPSNLLTVKSFTYLNASSEIVYVERKTYDYLDMYWPIAGSSDSPLFYCELNDSSLRVVPTPSAALPYTIRGIARPDGLTSSNNTSWLGTNVGDLLFLACLMESAIYLKEDPSVDGDRVGKIKAQYGERLAQAKKEFSRMGNADYDYIGAGAAPVRG
jgi:hypothetical protein